MAQAKTTLSDILQHQEADILSTWLQEQLSGGFRQRTLIKEDELRAQSKEFLSLLGRAVTEDASLDLQQPAWNSIRDFLANLVKSRGVQGFTSSEVATFVFSLKRPIFTLLRKELKTADSLADQIWAVTAWLDEMGLLTTELFMKAREEVIVRQQHEMMELSTPVVKLWDGVLALPLIGTLDSARTQVVMESLLQKIVETGSDVAIIDITGVPTVDTLVAQHLLKTVTAARLMGADCIISGIRPQIAQTIVHLGVALGNVSTKASLADAFQLALQRTGYALVRGPSGATATRGA